MPTLMDRIRNKLYNIYWNVRTDLHKKEKLKNVIVFESKPDLSDNTRAVYDEMIRRGLNQKYQLVWLLFESDVRQKAYDRNTYFLPSWDARAKYFEKVAKAKIFCNAFLKKETKEQVSIYLSHGTGIKDVRHSYRLPDWVDYCIAAAPGVEEALAEGLCFERAKTLGLGYPRNDALLKKQCPVKALLGTDCSKVVVWYPTFRQHACVKYTTIRNPIPLLDDLECAQKLNDAAVQADTLIVIKPHFAQDTQYIKEMNLSNIRFIDDSFFAQNNIRSYDFVGVSDGLITDYSSIYFDYTLCDKPIAAIWSDIEEYKKKPGLTANYETLCKGMEKIYTLDELTAFIRRIGDGVDLLQKERREIRDYANYSVEPTNADRVVDFIMKLIEK